MSHRPPATSTTAPQRLTCARCGGTLGELLPGGLLVLAHGGRRSVIASDSPLTFATTCARWLPATGRPCGAAATFITGAGPPGVIA
jgi:hypothetical protein